MSVAEVESGGEAVPDAVTGRPGQGVHEADGGQYCSQQPVPSVDMTGVQLALAETASQWPHTARASVYVVILDPKLPQDPRSRWGRPAEDDRGAVGGTRLSGAEDVEAGVPQTRSSAVSSG